jgi:soluble P-type ATPase
VTVRVGIPGAQSLALDYLLLDVNGTLTNRGMLIPGVAERLASLGALLDVRLLTADTYRNLDQTQALLGGVVAQRVRNGQDKAAIAEDLGPGRCAAIGNGANDEPMLRRVALAIAVLGPEGAASGTLLAARLVCPSIVVALDLLADSTALAATLRP